MASSILPISGPPAVVDAIRPAGAGQGGGAFQDAFSAAVQSVESSGQEAAGSVTRFLAGEGDEVHTAMLAVERAELSFDLFLQTRNKVVSAYQEIMRMQV
ncbi:MAG: flagellar hook-basal body complex protein FliE [Bryobacteraceae bacterium]|jgi:flagellar hook-basal body complex protein FliE